MNLSVYIFGNFHNGYSQYPNDYTQSIFKSFYKYSQATTQVVIRRSGDLMYYGYIRKLEENNYIGLCTLVNGKIVTKIDYLFSIYEHIIELMVRDGYLIHYSDNGEIVSKVGHLYENREEIDLISSNLQRAFNQLESTSRLLPAISYGTANDSMKSFSIQEEENDIIKSSYTNGYTFVYKSKGYNTTQMNSYKGIIAKKTKEIELKSTECESLKKELSALKNKQRNTLWVSLFAIIALILGVVVWNQVLFPNEVTKKDMGEYLYYGPLENGKPHGTGIAIYHSDDKDGRLYYYGKFSEGKRIDQNAIMFYKDGSYFKGSMNEDKWYQGLFFDVEKEHFIGEFKENSPWNGIWYKHVKAQTITNGE